MEGRVSLVECAKHVVTARSVNRLTMLCSVLEDYGKADSDELSPSTVLFSLPSLCYAGLATAVHCAPSGGEDVTDKERFMAPEELRGEAIDALFVRPHRAALLALYVLSAGPGRGTMLPYSKCKTRDELLAAEDLRFSRLKHWTGHRSECAVLDKCLSRSQPNKRPSLKELQSALSGLLKAKRGQLQDEEAVAFFQSFGTTKVHRDVLTRGLLFDALIIRNPRRMGGLRGMNSEFMKRAVTTMLCLQQLGLCKDVAFMVVQFQLAKEPNPFLRMAAEDEFDLTNEAAIEKQAKGLVRSLFRNVKLLTIADFARIVKLTHWKRNADPSWAFDLLRVFKMASANWCIIVDSAFFCAQTFFTSFDEDLVPPQVLIHPTIDGKFAFSRHCSFSSLFRCYVNSCFVTDVAAIQLFRRWFGSGLQIGKDICVLGVRVEKVGKNERKFVQYRIMSGGTHSCFVVKEGRRLFLAPAPEVPGTQTTFARLEQLVQFYEKELRWFQSWNGKDTPPPEWKWLTEGFRREAVEMRTL